MIGTSLSVVLMAKNAQMVEFVCVCNIINYNGPEMRMIRMMCGKSLKDKVNNSVLREWTNVEDIDEHLRGHRLRWLGYIEQMNGESLPTRV